MYDHSAIIMYNEWNYGVDVLEAMWQITNGFEDIKLQICQTECYIQLWPFLFNCCRYWFKINYIFLFRNFDLIWQEHIFNIFSKRPALWSFIIICSIILLKVTKWTLLSCKIAYGTLFSVPFKYYLKGFPYHFNTTLKFQ